MKILLAEDSPVQIMWAKEQLKGHNLIIAETSSEAERLMNVLRREPEDWIYIGDMFIPKTPGDEPKWENGLSLWTRPRDLGARNIKGTVLVSNYEHHRDGYDIDNALKERLISMFGTMGMGAFNSGRMQFHFDRSIRSVGDGHFYTHVYIGGCVEMLTNNNKIKGILLKPYKKILESMHLG